MENIRRFEEFSTNESASGKKMLIEDFMKEHGIPAVPFGTFMKIAYMSEGFAINNGFFSIADTVLDNVIAEDLDTSYEGSSIGMWSRRGHGFIAGELENKVVIIDQDTGRFIIKPWEGGEKEIKVSLDMYLNTGQMKKIFPDLSWLPGGEFYERMKVAVARINKTRSVFGK